MHIVLVLSGKGGVGKSSVTVGLALAFAQKGRKVGVLDADLTGPSLPRMFGVESRKVVQSTKGWMPVRVEGEALQDKQLSVMSLGFLVADRGNSIVWRGPRKTAMIGQLLADVHWDDLDYLLIDTPPGTGDEHIALAEALKDSSPDGAIVVTTPQALAVADVRKELNFCKKASLPVLGIVENMSGYICPHCSECTAIFSRGGGKKLAEATGVPFLGSLPIDPSFIAAVESGSIASKFPETGIAPMFTGIVNQLLKN